MYSQCFGGKLYPRGGDRWGWDLLEVSNKFNWIFWGLQTRWIQTAKSCFSSLTFMDLLRISMVSPWRFRIATPHPGEASLSLEFLPARESPPGGGRGWVIWIDHFPTKDPRKSITFQPFEGHGWWLSGGGEWCQCPLVRIFLRLADVPLLWWAHEIMIGFTVMKPSSINCNNITVVQDLKSSQNRLIIL